MFKKNKKFFDEFVIKIFPRLILIHESNKGPLFKYLNLVCMEKILSFSDVQVLEKVVESNKISFFFYRLL